VTLRTSFLLIPLKNGGYIPLTCFLHSFVLIYIKTKLAMNTTYCFNPQLRFFTKNEMIVSQNTL
ncbi:hypothetical protein CGJ72_24150, partial [Vibrio parahaemolyticus]